MEQRHPTSVNRSLGTVTRDHQKADAAPRFDETEIERARPAVPLDNIGSRARPSRGPRPLLAAAVVAGLAGGVLGGVGTAVYQRHISAQQARATQSAAVADEAAPATNDAQPQADETSAETRSAAPAEANATESVEPDVLEKASQEDSEAEGARADVDTETQLRGALDGWIAATNARDINRQMSFYDSRLGAFYLARGASRESVRAEKRRVFERASAVSVRASGATVRLAPDGRTAVMRFRKRYSIEGAGVERRGEVVQELRWRRTPQGWKIVSERDLRVVD